MLIVSSCEKDTKSDAETVRDTGSDAETVRDAGSDAEIMTAKYEEIKKLGIKVNNASGKKQIDLYNELIETLREYLEIMEYYGEDEDTYEKLVKAMDEINEDLAKAMGEYDKKKMKASIKNVKDVIESTEEKIEELEEALED